MITQQQIDKMFDKYMADNYYPASNEKEKETYLQLQDCFIAAINLLLPIIEKQNEALKFYGDEKSWLTFTEAYSEYSHQFESILCAYDCILSNDISDAIKDSEVGGKLARSTQKEVEEYLKGVLQEGKI